MIPKILVTGFGPFPGAPDNPSARLATKLARARRFEGRARIEGAVVPTVYEEVLTTLPDLIEAVKPDAILMFGLAAGTPHLRVETRAVNSASPLYPDAARKKGPQTLLPGAESRLKVRAPVHRLLAAARGTGVRARLSTDAGRYICNAALFVALAAAKKAPKHPPAVFVHIPLPRPRRRKKRGRRDRRPTFRQIEHAGEAILLALAAAAKERPSPSPSG